MRPNHRLGALMLLAFFHYSIGDVFAGTVTLGPTDEVQQAIDDLRPGDTLRLTSGIYQGPFTISVNGTPLQPIVITSASRELDRPG
ncbi:MAG: hypothetical protein AAGA85_17610 [Bacteroidota bacterium]